MLRSRGHDGEAGTLNAFSIHHPHRSGQHESTHQPTCYEARPVVQDIAVSRISRRIHPQFDHQLPRQERPHQEAYDPCTPHHPRSVPPPLPFEGVVEEVSEHRSTSGKIDPHIMLGLLWASLRELRCHAIQNQCREHRGWT
jgi:hypothetical protein